jgi:glycine cleavage system regulatory protein
VPFSLQAVGVDKAGIVAKISRCLADQQINIRQMQSQSRPQPESGTPMYTMNIRMDVPRSLDEKSLRDRLEAVARDLNIEVTLARADG